MGKLISIILALYLSMVSVGYPLKNGKPTARGVDVYVEDMGDSIILEYQEFIGDTLYNVEILTEEPENFDDRFPIELGYYFPYEISIMRSELFEAYELKDLSPRRRRSFRECNRFVKGVIIHELTHAYVNQLGIEMRSIDLIPVQPAYEIDIWIIRSHETYGSRFIEEGLCEYVAGKMGELIPPPKPFVPLSIEDLNNSENRYSIQYKYAAFYLKPFLDTLDFKQAVKILLYNPPPTQEEILDASLFFSRLKSPE